MNASEKEIYEVARDVYNREKEFGVDYAQYKDYTERCVEVPFVADCINRCSINSLLDIGFTFASHDYLRLVLDFKKQNKLTGVDIIEPLNVKSRYPKEWWNEINNTEVIIGDFSGKINIKNEMYDAVTLISTLEHIGFDKKALTDIDSAFDRKEKRSDVIVSRDEDVEERVLKNAYDALKEDGYCIITVPAGKGGSIIMQDGKGLFACLNEYNKKSWDKIIGSDLFDCVLQKYYILDDERSWIEKESIEDLSEVTCDGMNYAHGVACCVLQKR